jgi:hypothetical protein
MLETFCLRLATGLVVALLLLPARVVNPRFYRIHLRIVLGLTVAAGMAAWDTAPDAFWLTFGLALSASVIGSWCWFGKGGIAGYAAVLVTVGALAVALVQLSLGGSQAKTSGLWPLAEDGASALLLGVATTAMLMGHWYLIAPTMSLAPLMWLLAVLFAATGVRMLTAGVGLWHWAEAVAGFDRLTWLWLALRWGAGFGGTLVLTWMAWQAARIRSTQSATGILYVVVIFCFVGELTDQLLHGHLLTLAGDGL